MPNFGRFGFRTSETPIFFKAGGLWIREVRRSSSLSAQLYTVASSGQIASALLYPNFHTEFSPPHLHRDAPALYLPVKHLPLTRSPPLMRVALLIAAGLAALCPPASGQTVFSRPYEPNQIALEAFVPERPDASSFGSSGTKASSAIWLGS